MFHVVVFVFLEFVDTEYYKLTFIRHTAVKYVHFILATAILDFWRTPTSRDTRSGTIKKSDPENMGIAVGILLLCALELEICLGVKYPPAAGKRRQKTAAGTRVKSLYSFVFFSILSKSEALDGRTDGCNT